MKSLKWVNKKRKKLINKISLENSFFLFDDICLQLLHQSSQMSLVYIYSNWSTMIGEQITCKIIKQNDNVMLFVFRTIKEKTNCYIKWLMFIKFYYYFFIQGLFPCVHVSIFLLLTNYICINLHKIICIFELNKRLRRYLG